MITVVVCEPLEEELNLLVVVMDVNPIWWGQQTEVLYGDINNVSYIIHHVK